MLCDLVLLEAFSAQTTSCLARAERGITGLKDVSLLFDENSRLYPSLSSSFYTYFRHAQLLI
jgi:hypothetical protein